MGRFQSYMLNLQSNCFGQHMCYYWSLQQTHTDIDSVDGNHGNSDILRKKCSSIAKGFTQQYDQINVNLALVVYLSKPRICTQSINTEVRNSRDKEIQKTKFYRQCYINSLLIYTCNYL